MTLDHFYAQFGELHHNFTRYMFIFSSNRDEEEDKPEKGSSGREASMISDMNPCENVEEQKIIIVNVHESPVQEQLDEI